MNPIDLLNSPVANALGWTLLHTLWQGFALVLPTAVVLYLLRNRSSTLRYQIGVIALLAQLLISVVTFVAYYQPAQASMSIGAIGYSSQPPESQWSGLPQTLPWHEQIQQLLATHLSHLVFVYLIGLVIFGLRLAGGWLYLHRLRQTAVLPATQSLTMLTEQLRISLSLRAAVRVRESARIAVPLIVGTLKPILLMPVSLAAGLSMREMQAVLAHELAHVKRHDYAVNLLQSVMDVLYFFHPALWWLSERVREEREHCCDDLAVMACGGNGRILAQALARVEELRIHYNSPTPALAMALATNRQLLLHRVRRMLGVSTRPVTSNSSLAGLTAATLLLISVSVYAVQQVPLKQPKPHVSQPKSTRRHTVNSSSEYGMADNKRISYVVWKGQKLPASRVARLQRQLDQVMGGQLSLDAVKQPDRDILLTIIEKNNSFDSGMGALADGLVHIDYDNIVASAMNNVPLSPDGTVEGLKDVDYGQIIRDAFASIPQVAVTTDSLKRITAQHKLDSLLASMNTVMAQRKAAIDQITKEMAAIGLKNQDVEKQLAPLRTIQSRQAGKMGELAIKQAQLATKQVRLLQRNDARSRAMQRQMEIEQSRLEKQMEQYERQMEQATGQLEPLTSRLEPTQERLSVLADSLSRLYEPITAMSEQIGELSEQISEDAMQQAETAMRLVKNMHPNTPPLPARPSLAPRPPRPLRGTVLPTPHIAPTAPYKAVGGVVVPVKPVVPARPKVSATPAPKVAPAPKPTPAVAPIPPK